MQGQCLCGAVKVTVEDTEEFAVCHCGMCRQWAGGPMMCLHCEEDIHVDGEDSVARYDSSEWAERCFCKSCGTHLFYHLKGQNQHFVSVGLFDNQHSFKMAHQIFIDKKPDYYAFSNQTPTMTEQQVFEMFAPQ
jgi:hypothetical protein